MSRILVLTALFISFVLTGCGSKFFNIGKNKGYCEEIGCDYSDAGVCASPYYILKNKELAKELAYKRLNSKKESK